jgi:threonine synthase
MSPFSGDVLSVGDLGAGKKLGVCELFLGPTLAFKDLGLQFIARCFDYFLEKSGKKVSLLVATSGDTGSAALRAFEGSKHASLFVIYPPGKIGATQELQMVTVDAPNLAVFAVEGSNSDSLDQLVYEVFSDKKFAEEVGLGSVNSFNFARIMVQITHFVWAYFRACPACDEEVLITIPTGAFGNAVSGYLARRMVNLAFFGNFGN